MAPKKTPYNLANRTDSKIDRLKTLTMFAPDIEPITDLGTAKCSEHRTLSAVRKRLGVEQQIETSPHLPNNVPLQNRRNLGYRNGSK